MKTSKLFTDSMTKALKVINLIDKKFPNLKEQAGAHVEAYSNCREQGLTLTISTESNGKYLTTKFAISENRNSDSIVVYQGEYGEFSMQGSVPSEEVYRASNYFDDEKAAVKHLSKIIKALVNSEEHQALLKSWADKKAI